jgi:hypothetical protein
VIPPIQERRIQLARSARRRRVTQALLAVFFATAALIWLPVASLGEWTGSVRTDIGFFRLSIAADKTIYQVGEPVRLRIELTNVSPGDAVVYAQNPVMVAKLEVADANGHRLTSDGYNVLPCKTICSFVIHPKSTWTAKSPNGGEWFDLRRWGYALTTPGLYTIIAYPNIAGVYPLSGHETGEVHAPWGHIVPDANPMPSNTVRVQLLP